MVSHPLCAVTRPRPNDPLRCCINPEIPKRRCRCDDEIDGVIASRQGKGREKKTEKITPYSASHASKQRKSKERKAKKIVSHS